MRPLSPSKRSGEDFVRILLGVVNDEERSQLILTAVENVFGKEEALRITIVMGLTPAEAENIGIPLS